MNFKFIYLSISCFLTLFSSQCMSGDCFSYGERWHDIQLPKNIQNVRWLSADNIGGAPFMSITFDALDGDMDEWFKKCGVNLEEIRDFDISGKNLERKPLGYFHWSEDIMAGTGGFISVMRYKNNRFCVGIERTANPDVKSSLNNKPYYGCPLVENIDY